MRYCRQKWSHLILLRTFKFDFYVVKLLEELTQMATEEAIELNLVLQISFKNYLRGNFSPPDPLKPYTNLNYVPIPIKATNFLIRHPKLFLPLVGRSFGLTDIFHGTNYTVFPFRKSRQVMTIYEEFTSGVN
jgi:hypothetical protein